jgi:tubulin polyglutamylase TTLL5
VESVFKYNLNRSNCFDVFGFDIMIDSNIKPWLIEVNLSPSLAVDAPIDMNIKGNLIADTFNLIRIMSFDRKKETLNRVRRGLRR